MSTARLFPGVFIDEIPSGVQTITGVPTAIAAFVGRTQMGPVNDPVIVNSFGDFQRNFGGLDARSSVGYAVRDFFQNGGGQAVIVRLFNPAAAPGAAITFTNGANSLVLHAANPGTWANGLTVLLDANVSSEIPPQLGLPDASSVFNLTITLGSVTETIRNLTLIESPRRFDRVLADESLYVRGTFPSTVTNAGDLIPATPPPNVPAGSALATVSGAVDTAALTPTDYISDPTTKTGVQALENTDLFNILCIPPDTRADTWGDTATTVFSQALAYCVTRRAMLLIDPPATMTVAGLPAYLTSLNLGGTNARNAALYFPRLIESDPLRDNKPDRFVPCGAVAGLMARTDGQRGVFKAPAGVDAGFVGIQGLAITLTDQENGQINPIGVNALRTFPVIGSVIWGARTLRGSDQLGDDYKYVPVRRLALFIEESLIRGTRFAVFEPNADPLWAQIRLAVGAFMNDLFRQGAFQGKTARDAYLVKCDSETTNQNDINSGVVNILVAFAPVKPAEFVVIQIQQLAGQVAA